jgi:hypothetical protein
MRGELWLVGCAALAVTAGSLACSEPCCTYDSAPISLSRGEKGELLAHVRIDGKEGTALVDTGTPITLYGAALSASPNVQRREVRLIGSSARDGAPVRAILRETLAVDAPLSPIHAEGGATVAPLALLGGDLLGNFSVEVGFAAPELVLWREQRASDVFLSGAGYAVLHTKRLGGGQLDTLGPHEGIGPRGPYQYPPSLLVMRACGAPALFQRDSPLPGRCCVGDERTSASGTDLSLLLGTGFGPIILSRSAWTRVVRQLPAPPATVPGKLLVATSTELDAQWSALPRLALVDREAAPADDPGPCVELGRARRTEQVAISQAHNAERALCAPPCDQDPRNSDHRAQNSAGYLELAGDLQVAIIDDGEPLLQTLRAEVRPEGPELDGILGAGVLRNARAELDYRTQPSRTIFSCEASALASECRAVGQCPRLPKPGQTHSCFGLAAHALPRICDNPTACE